MQCKLFSDSMMDCLYGELDDAGQARFQEHLGLCAECRAEWEDLRGVRRDLGAWRLPELGARPFRFARPRRWLPVAAAATVILSIGASLAVSKPTIRHDGGGTQISFGSSTDIYVERLEHQLQAQEQRHQQELASLKAAVLARAAVPAAGDSSAGLEDVKRLIRDSELRLEQRFAVRLADWREQGEAQRRYDLARVAASLAYLQGENGQHMARTTELVGYMLDASQKGAQLR